MWCVWYVYRTVLITYKNKLFSAFSVTPFAINSSGEPDGKKAKLEEEEEEEYNLANITEGTVTSVRF